jgi:hypothetical protein
MKKVICGIGLPTDDSTCQFTGKFGVNREPELSSRPRP